MQSASSTVEPFCCKTWPVNSPKVASSVPLSTSSWRQTAEAENEIGAPGRHRVAACHVRSNRSRGRPTRSRGLDNYRRASGISKSAQISYGLPAAPQVTVSPGAGSAQVARRRADRESVEPMTAKQTRATRLEPADGEPTGAGKLAREESPSPIPLAGGPMISASTCVKCRRRCSSRRYSYRHRANSGFECVNFSVTAPAA